MVNRRSLFLCATRLFASTVAPVTALFADRAVRLDKARVEKGDLWIPAVDMIKVNEFEIKPQGACRKDLCIPLPKDMKSKGWVNLSGFARKVKQSVVNDGEYWSFSEMPVLSSGFLESRIAPDFSVKNRNGDSIQLSQFRGKKVLLLTWASW